MLIRFIIGAFFVLHGLVHGLYVAHSRRLIELQPGMAWPDGSWAFSRLLGVEATRWVAAITYAMAGFGFVASGISLFVGLACWRPLVVGSAAFSAGMVLLFWNGGLHRLDNEGLFGLLIDGAILLVLLVVGWIPAGF